MGKKRLTFTEPMYGGRQEELIKTGLIYAGIVWPSRKGSRRRKLYDALISWDVSKMRELENQIPQVAKLFGDHSGASWLAVQWAAGSLLMGCEIEVVSTGNVFTFNYDKEPERGLFTA